jgi:methylmalonyl-CoA carboxyltransferase 5S subunit
LVTPSSQIVGTQAVFNVLIGPYKVLTAEFADLMLGYYGATLGERDPQIVEAARAQTSKEPIDVRPADLLEPEWDQLVAAANAAEGCNGTDEDVLTYAMFPGVAPKFFAERPDGPRNVGKDSAEVATDKLSKASGAGPVTGPIRYSVTLGGKAHHVTVERA